MDQIPPDRFLMTPYDQQRLDRAVAQMRLGIARMEVAAVRAAEAMRRFNITCRRSMETAELGAVQEVHRLALAHRARN